LPKDAASVCSHGIRFKSHEVAGDMANQCKQAESRVNLSLKRFFQYVGAISARSSVIDQTRKCHTRTTH
jgi:hypothetical protein